MDDPKVSFLVQKFARFEFGAFSLIGYSVGGEETVVQAPELGVCFDIGRCPQFALTSDIVCVTHGHMDHVAGLGYYLSQRHFQGMKPGTILVPREIERPIEALLRAWRDVERQPTPYNLVPMQPGQLYEVRRDFGIRAWASHHGGASLAYALISIREKLKPEFADKSGPELVELKKRGVTIQYRIEVPMVAFVGDTTAGPVFDQPDVRTAQVLITECTFFDPGHRVKSKAGKHLHLDQFAEILPTLENQWVVIGHVTRRTGLRRAKNLLRKAVGEKQAARVLFLMDLEDAGSAGDIEQTIPLADTPDA
jgi:ribonuclease Z